MAKSARKLLSAPEARVTVDVDAAKQVAENLVALSFTLEHVRYDDLYNASAEQIDTLLQDRAGERVTVTLGGDSSVDADGHPEVLEARVVSTEPSAVEGVPADAAPVEGEASAA